MVRLTPGSRIDRATVSRPFTLEAGATVSIETHSEDATASVRVLRRREHEIGLRRPAPRQSGDRRREHADRVPPHRESLSSDLARFEDLSPGAYRISSIRQVDADLVVASQEFRLVAGESHRCREEIGRASL